MKLIGDHWSYERTITSGKQVTCEHYYVFALAMAHCASLQFMARTLSTWKKCIEGHLVGYIWLNSTAKSYVDLEYEPCILFLFLNSLTDDVRIASYCATYETCFATKDAWMVNELRMTQNSTHIYNVMQMMIMLRWTWLRKSSYIVSPSMTQELNACTLRCMHWLN